jgi:hypothetical protein
MLNRPGVVADVVVRGNACTRVNDVAAAIAIDRCRDKLRVVDQAHEGWTRRTPQETSR